MPHTIMPLASFPGFLIGTMHATLHVEAYLSQMKIKVNGKFGVEAYQTSTTHRDRSAASQL
jgi:hypothetical protein